MLKTLTERWNGVAWSVVPSPNSTGKTINQLNGVSCTSPANCFAVGSSQLSLSSSSDALIERWNGKTWSIIPGAKGTLSGVSCTSTTFCIAVGVAIQRWNGNTWSTAKTPPNFFGGNGVSCTSATSCSAVNGSIAKRWNGKNWSIVPSPQPGSGDDWGLNGVACTSATNCQGVGSRGGCVGCFDNWAESWDGKTWSVVPAPEPKRSTGAVLNGVSCPSPTNCTAVGYYGFGGVPGDVPLPFAENWDGNAWTPVTARSPKNSYAGFNAVSCPSVSDCFAVGFTQSGPAGWGKTLTERWNGTTWSIIASPNVG